MNKTFNISEWLPEEQEEPQKIVQTTTVQPSTNKLNNDIELITQRIEIAGIDIAPSYDDWLTLGFSFSDALGESGRTYYHRTSRFYKNYSAAETDKQYDKCLKAKGTGVTISSFFHLANVAGINIKNARTISAKSAISTISANHQSADIAEYADIADTEENNPLPCFSPEVKDNLPDFLKKIVCISNSDEDADILILGSLTVLSSCLPNISGNYHSRQVFPNLFLFITAKASSGKGRLTLCRYLVEPIHDCLRQKCELEEIEYQKEMAEYNAAGKEKKNLDKPEVPPMRMLFIPANGSATAVYQVLSDNDGSGLIFESEGDTLANTFGSDYGNYSDGFRKAFHHENISYIRRKDREYVSIKQPRLSTLLTGTPHQILNLITDAENGLFSRFTFYSLRTNIVWQSPFSGNEANTTLDDYFRNLGSDFFDFYTILKSTHQVQFKLSEDQITIFDSTFEKAQMEYYSTYGDEIIPSVRRQGLVTYRIAMILTTLRMWETGEYDETIVCNDTDFTTALMISKVLLQHMAKVFTSLPHSYERMVSNNEPKTQQLQQFLQALPEEFDRKKYSDIALSVGLIPKSIDRTIKKWCEEGIIVRIAHGKYHKNQQTRTIC